MTITARRIFKKKHATSAWTGDGGRLYGGRWNSKGTRVVYTSESLSLAVLEILVHLQPPEILNAYLAASVSFENRLVENLPPAKLPTSWRKYPAPARLRKIGDLWIVRGGLPILRVPSVIIENEYNYLLNPAHPRFGECTLGRPERFLFDRRLLKNPQKE